MQNDSEVYVDPDEDEVFFGCVSEKEKTASAKLKHAAQSLTGDCELDKISDNCVYKSFEELLKNKEATEINKAVVPNETTDSPQPNEKTMDSNKMSNTSVELEHNYSTPVKHKIDKSILATPKSIVKADKDGGFLKVLSEIAIVKAEAEGDSNSENKDEDKENKITPVIPEIKVTEATPEKTVIASPPKAISTELRRFRIIYNSPRNEEVNHKSKSNVESFESERNIKNKLLDQEVEVLGSSRRRNSIDLIDFSDEKEKEEKKDSAGETKPVCDVITLMDSPEKDDEGKESSSKPPVRFSKDARKIVEVLKKSAVDDTLNFTIPEINIEEEENSFVSPELPSAFDETVISNQTPVPVQQKKESPKTTTQAPTFKSRTVEKRTPALSQTKLLPVKYFSERRIYKDTGSEMRKCVRRLPLEDKKSTTVEKANGVSNEFPLSRIPVFGAKNSKIPLFERVAKTTPGKTIPGKISSAKSFKNSKFNHIESPVNAYIHNKPTTFVLNVKPEVRKEGMAKVWKTGSGNKVEEKRQKEQNGNSVIKLPFVEYKSTTAFNIEKRPESRLPRLAPTVYKLIGSNNSPKVLRHEGRFYMNSPRKESTENTIVADPNEVSVVMNQPAQKSNTIK